MSESENTSVFNIVSNGSDKSSEDRIEHIKKMINKGANINEKGPIRFKGVDRKLSPLEYAMMDRDEVVIEFLIKSGAEIDDKIKAEIAKYKSSNKSYDRAYGDRLVTLVKQRMKNNAIKRRGTALRAYTLGPMGSLSGGRRYTLRNKRKDRKTQRKRRN